MVVADSLLPAPQTRAPRRLAGGLGERRRGFIGHAGVFSKSPPRRRGLRVSLRPFGLLHFAGAGGEAVAQTCRRVDEALDEPPEHRPHGAEGGE